MTVTLDVFLKEPGGERHEAGEPIFSAGDEGHAMYVVIEGEVELRIGTAIVATLGPGEPFGEMALIDQGSRVTTALARTACRLAVIDEKRFDFLVQQHPYFARQVMKVMAERLRKMDVQAYVPA
jgi:CRP/FNR family transcriptional regulator, cyclic AMP receptor protein